MPAKTDGARHMGGTVMLMKQHQTAPPLGRGEWSGESVLETRPFGKIPKWSNFEMVKL